MKTMEMNDDFKTILSDEIEYVSKVTSICPMILGEPGIGKSSIIRAMCEEKGWHFFELLCNQLGDRADLTGCRSVKTIKNINGVDEEVWQQVFFPHQSIQDAISCAKENPNDIVVLFLDEINRTSSDITSAILSFTTARKIGTYTFPDNIRFVVAGNDKGNVTALDGASISRFVEFKLIPSAETYMNVENKLNPYIKAVLTKNPELIFCQDTNISMSVNDSDDSANDEEYSVYDDDADGFYQITTPRTISGLNAFLNACSNDKLCHYISEIVIDNVTNEESNLLQTIITGHIGDTEFAKKLCAVIADNVNSLVLNGQATVDAPDKPDIYDDIITAVDRQTRNDMLVNLSEDDKAALILYMTWDKSRDNSEVLSILVKSLPHPSLPSEYQIRFSKLKGMGAMDDNNYAAVISTDSDFSRTIACILGE